MKKKANVGTYSVREPVRNQRTGVGGVGNERACIWWSLSNKV